MLTTLPWPYPGNARLPFSVHMAPRSWPRAHAVSEHLSLCGALDLARHLRGVAADIDIRLYVPSDGEGPHTHTHTVMRLDGQHGLPQPGRYRTVDEHDTLFDGEHLADALHAFCTLGTDPRVEAFLGSAEPAHWRTIHCGRDATTVAAPRVGDAVRLTRRSRRVDGGAPDHWADDWEGKVVAVQPFADGQDFEVRLDTGEVRQVGITGTLVTTIEIIAPAHIGARPRDGAV